MSRSFLQCDHYISDSQNSDKFEDILLGQNSISQQGCKIFIPKFPHLYVRDPATILKLLKNLFRFFQSYG